MQIIPAVNCRYKDFACVEEKIRTAEKIFADLAVGSKKRWVHVDVADGIFTHHKMWNNPAEWKKLKTPLKLEVHLMVEEPLREAHRWFEAGAARIVVHAETISERDETILKLADQYGAEAMCSTNPETHVRDYASILKKFSMFQVLAVHPGLAGQKFLPEMIRKITALRMMFPHAIIEIDGGVNLENAKRIKTAGADILVAATAIFGAKNPKKAYEKLKEV